MGDLSIIEFGVYGFIVYSSMLMLIISVIKDVPTTKNLAISRAVWLIPAVVLAFVLSSSTGTITTFDTTNTIVSLNTTEVFVETISQRIVLLDPIWVLVHLMFGFVLIIYIIIQLLTLFTKIE